VFSNPKTLPSDAVPWVSRGNVIPWMVPVPPHTNPWNAVFVYPRCGYRYRTVPESPSSGAHLKQWLIRLRLFGRDPFLFYSTPVYSTLLDSTC
jgi:hypothetical protein